MASNIALPVTPRDPGAKKSPLCDDLMGISGGFGN